VTFRVPFVIGIGFFGLSLLLAAQSVVLDRESYLTPPEPIAEAIRSLERESTLLTNISPDGTKFLIPKNDGMPPLSRLAKSTVYLGEMAFDPTAYRSKQLWVRSLVGYDIFLPPEKKTISIQVPPNARVSNAAWSPDGSQLAFFAHFPDATHIYVANTGTGASRPITQVPVLATLVTTFQWSKDGTQILTVLRPDGGKTTAPKFDIAPSPRVRLARDGAQPSRTYRFLLESPEDAQLLEHLVTGQLALISVANGETATIGEPAMLRSISMSPNGEQFRVATIKKPFSYFVPLTRFGSTESIWDRGGKLLYTLIDRGIQDTDPSTQPTPANPAIATAVNRGMGGRARPNLSPGTPTTTGPMPPMDPTVNPNPDPTAPVDPDVPPRSGATTSTVDPEGRRDFVWRPDGAGLSFLQQEPPDPKEPNKPRKDRVMQWLPPFEKDKAIVVYETPHRISSLQYAADASMIFLTQTIDNQRTITAIDLKDANKTAYVIYKATGGAGRGDGSPMANPMGSESFDPSHEQRPGTAAGLGSGGVATLLTRANGTVRISSRGEVYLTGVERPRGIGAPSFPKPYIDKIDIKTGNKQRIFEGKGDLFETIHAVDSDDVRLVYTTRQKSDVVPDSYVTDLAQGQSEKLTNNVNPAPWLTTLRTLRFQVTRVDGFKFWVRVTMPSDRAGKLPALFWIYPREYTDQAAYDAAVRTSTNTQRFNVPTPRSMSLLALVGYAVVEPDIPIVGPAGRMNDNYVPDLRNSLWAVIDELDKRSIIDRDRLAVGGHSYGAFSTANAMIHTPFFKAGIAGDGNYNRTLTMMTFQSERRQLWDARETYLEMSPLLFANRLHGALLMYHGLDDANVGTNPINAEFMFMALDGLGKPAALYMYPYEGHGPLARETILDLWTRWIAWLDKYVKGTTKNRVP
jgi:dipeptidyl aminopeptidase/acylaminoacyl peptidase